MPDRGALPHQSYRHDDHQQAAERIAAVVAPFEFAWAPGRTLMVTEGMAIAVIRSALDEGLIVEAIDG